MPRSKKYHKRIALEPTVSVTDVITVYLYDMAPEYDLNKVTCYDFWEIFYIDRGQAELTVGGKERTVRQGDAIFIKPGETSTIRCDGVHSASVYIITFVSESAAMKAFEGVTAKIRGELSHLMQKLISESEKTFAVSKYPLKLLKNAPVASLQMVRMCLEMFLITLLREGNGDKKEKQSSSRRSKDDKLVAKEVADYLRSRVADRVTVSEVVRRFNFGKSYLSETFRREYGVSMMSYHTILKIEEAKRMLREEGLTVAEVSERLSFDSPEYFSRVFKKAEGIPPTTFRRTLISGKLTRLPIGRG